MDALSALRQRVVDAQRALGLPEPPPPAADVSAARGSRTEYTNDQLDTMWAALDARDGLLFAGLALVCTVPAVVEKAPPARRLAGAVLGTAGAGLFVLGAVGGRFDFGRHIR